MTLFQAIILGLVQGFTEVLPISSSAHLYLVPYIFDWDYQGLGFDVALHWGTLLAVIIIFWKDYLRYIKAFLGSLFRPPMAMASGFALEKETSAQDKKMAWFLVLGSIPAAIAGFFFQSQAETIFRSPWVTVFTLSGFGILLWIADRFQASGPKLQASVLTWKKVLFVGVAQALAIVPGVSRSGATITAGLFGGLSREAATRFAFLLSGPIIFGAGLVALPDLQTFDATLAAGFLAAAVSGFLAIKFLLKFVSGNNFNLFVGYRILFAVIILLALLTR